MYNIIKKLAYDIGLKEILLNNENMFRRALSLFYVGNNVECNICNKKFRKFLDNQRGEKLCPNCGSLPRDRRLFYELEKNVLIKSEIKILDFSPSRSIYRKLKQKNNIQYFPTDFSGEFIAEHQYDITSIPVEDNFFNYIVCFHILEHIEEDMKAMTELYRVVDSNGIVFIQTPFKIGDIYENNEINTPELRQIHFGQNDHVRVYSVESLKNRLKMAGFKVEVKLYNAEKNNRFGFSLSETILFCRKI